MKYYEDEEYKEAMKEYSEYSQRCSISNKFDPKDSCVFEKRNEFAKKLNEIKEKYV